MRGSYTHLFRRQNKTILGSFDNLASKSVFVIKFACANLALKTSKAKALKSEVQHIYHDYDY